MSPPTNPRLEVCPETAQTLQEISLAVEPDNQLGSFNDVPRGSSFRIVVEAEVTRDAASTEATIVTDVQEPDSIDAAANLSEQYFILRRTHPQEGEWYDWRLYAGDAVEGRPVVLYGAVTETGSLVDRGSIIKGMGFLLAEVDLHPLNLPAPEGAAVIADGVLATRFINLGAVKQAIGIPQEGSTTNDAVEN